jgi:hypothetical protein
MKIDDDDVEMQKIQRISNFFFFFFFSSNHGLLKCADGDHAVKAGVRGW